MTRNECISLSCKIKENPSAYQQDLSNFLYAAVGMVKLSPDAGTLFAGYLLVDAITEVGYKLTPFQQRRVDIILNMWAKKYGKMMDNIARTAEIADYNAQVRMINRYCEG